MNLISSADENWGIGFEGGLLQRIPEDMKFFKETTLGKVVVMGRVTFDSLPGKKPLTGRINIVLTRDKEFKAEGAIVCNSCGELFSELKKFASEDIFLIGGAEIFNKLLPYCRFAYITKIFKSYNADRFLTNLDKDTQWHVIDEGELKEYNNIQFKVFIYENRESLLIEG